MQILGIDPGIERTGWAVIRCSKGQCEALSYGCITTARSQSTELRLNDLFDKMSAVIAQFDPQEAAIEELFFNKNVKTALVVGHARGVVLLALARKLVPLFHYTPLEVKLSVAGYGRADKGQVQDMIKILLHLTKVPKPDDVADALAVALTHAAVSKPK